MTRHPARPGVTLMEVLVASFIMAVGLVSAMAFFPVGAMNMVRSVRDQRSAQLAANSNTMLHAWWKDCWVDPATGLVIPEEVASSPAGGESTIEWLDTDRYTGTSILRVDSGHSHPVMIDPLGAGVYGPLMPDILPPSNGSTSVPSVGGFMPRLYLNKVFGTNPAIVGTSARRNQLRLCALPDDMAFAPNGEADNPGDVGNKVNQFDRGYRYSCAWVLQREHNSNPYDVRVHTLTFDARPLDLPDGDQFYATADLSLPDQVTLPSGNLQAFQLQIKTLASALPRTRKGGWIMVAYHANYKATPTSAKDFKPSRWIVSFHRTTGQNDVQVGSDNFRTLALEHSIQTPQYFDDVRVVVFEKLIEVFDRGTMSVVDRPW